MKKLFFLVFIISIACHPRSIKTKANHSTKNRKQTAKLEKVVTNKNNDNDAIDLGITISRSCWLIGDETSFHISPNKKLTFNVNIHNGSEVKADNILVVVDLPDKLEYISADPSYSYIHKNSTKRLFWQITDLKSYSTRTVKLSVQGLAVGVFTAKIKAVHQKTIVSTAVRITCPGFVQLRLISYETEDPVAVGHYTIYILELYNEGTGQCTGLKLEYVVDKKLQFIKANGPTIFYRKGLNTIIFERVAKINPGEKVTYKIVCQATAIGTAKNCSIFTYKDCVRPTVNEQPTAIYE